MRGSALMADSFTVVTIRSTAEAEKREKASCLRKKPSSQRFARSQVFPENRLTGVSLVRTMTTTLPP
ncbi:hypothetical protein GCM10009762_21260 [Dermacoccus barathri]|uniref:Uncharacterized protein n=1 Tax=Dermacoccus barathri TaxID=322601 RepID=A0ABN2BVB1_9MICO